LYCLHLARRDQYFAVPWSIGATEIKLVQIVWVGGEGQDSSGGTTRTIRVDVEYQNQSYAYTIRYHTAMGAREQNFKINSHVDDVVDETVLKALMDYLLKTLNKMANGGFEVWNKLPD
jgi:hypothetical protein